MNSVIQFADLRTDRSWGSSGFGWSTSNATDSSVLTSFLTIFKKHVVGWNSATFIPE